MSESGIREKILKIRQELENFSISDNPSLEAYNIRGFNQVGVDMESSSILNLGIPEDSKLSPIQGSQRFANRDYLFKTQSEAELKDLKESKDLRDAGFEGTSMKTDTQLFQSIKEQELTKHNKKLLANLHESRAYYIQLIAEKDDLISKYREQIFKDENNIAHLKKGCMNIEELKDSTRKLISESDKIEKEKSDLLQENRALKEKILRNENEFEKIKENFEILQEKFKEISENNAKNGRKVEELLKENEFLYKTLNKDKKVFRYSSFSPGKKFAFSGIGKSSSFGRRTALLGEGEKTERLSSPLPRSNRKRSSSKSSKKDLHASASHLTTCKIVKDLLSSLSLSSASEILPTVSSLSSQVKTQSALVSFFSKLQKLISENSPPGSFKSPPSAKTSMNWIKRLVQEYLELKSSGFSPVHGRILSILQSGLSTKNIEDIPKAISKLLVENEKQLKIIEKVKKILKFGPNTSLEQFEIELELRNN